MLTCTCSSFNREASEARDEQMCRPEPSVMPGKLADVSLKYGGQEGYDHVQGTSWIAQWSHRKGRNIPTRTDGIDEQKYDTTKRTDVTPALMNTVVWFSLLRLPSSKHLTPVTIPARHPTTEI
jgi:hypothetical protein